MTKTVFYFIISLLFVLPEAQSLDFRNYCDSNAHPLLTLPESEAKSAKQTVAAIMRATRSMNCEQAWDALQTSDYLSLAGMHITNIQPLIGFSGVELDLSDNDIESLWGLEHLPQLQKLFINNNKISDLSTISLFSSLKTLNISDNPLGLNGCFALKDLPQLYTLYAAGTELAEDPEEILGLAHHIFQNQVKLGQIRQDDINGKAHQILETISIAEYITNSYRPITIQDLEDLGDSLDEFNETNISGDENWGSEHDNMESVDTTKMSFMEQYVHLSLELAADESIKEALQRDADDITRFQITALIGADKWDFPQLRKELRIAPITDRDVDSISRSVINKKRIRSFLHTHKFFEKVQNVWKSNILKSSFASIQKNIILEKINERSPLLLRALEYKFASSDAPLLNEAGFQILADELIKVCPNMMSIEKTLQKVDEVIEKFAAYQIPLSMRSGHR